MNKNKDLIIFYFMVIISCFGFFSLSISADDSENIPPIAAITGPYYATVGTVIIFDGSGSTDLDGTIEGYRWDFTNDGVFDTAWLSSAITSYSYPSVGTYTVRLEVMDDDGATETDTTVAFISSNNESMPTAEANGPYSGYVNYPVAFSSAGSSSGSETYIVSWYWMFGDGAVSTQQNPIHTYLSPGTFNVTLIVEDSRGQTAIDWTTCIIVDLSGNEIPPVANAGGPYEGVVGFPLSFDGSYSVDSDGIIVTYLWDFGDKTTGIGISPTHTYGYSGNYTVELRTIDNNGLSNSNITTAHIIALDVADIAITLNVSTIDLIEEQTEKTLSIMVFCYHQSVSNIHLEILDASNLTVTILSSNISLNPGESESLFISVKAPKLDKSADLNDHVMETETYEKIVLRAVGEGGVISNTEQVLVKVIAKQETPGFGLMIGLSAIVVMLFLQRRLWNYE